MNIGTKTEYIIEVHVKGTRTWRPFEYPKTLKGGYKAIEYFRKKSRPINLKYRLISQTTRRVGMA